LQESLERQAGGGNRAAAADKDKDKENAQAQAAAGDAARELQRQRTAERMQQSADAMRTAADRGQGTQRGNTAAGAQSGETRAQAGAQDAMARELDRVADKLAAGTGAKDAESKKLSDRLAQVQQQREALDRIGRELGQSGQQNGAAASQGQSAQK